MISTGARALIDVLLEQGVDTVFGYPGSAVLDIYDELYKCDKIRHILTCHEQAAAHAADGYARATGKTGVVIATSGPGATNLVTGIAAAYMDSSPVVAITGNVKTSLLGSDSFQEVDIAGVTMPVTKYSFIASGERGVAQDVREAFSIAQSGRKGPVLVDIPADIAAQSEEYERAPKSEPARAKARTRGADDSKSKKTAYLCRRRSNKLGCVRSARGIRKKAANPRRVLDDGARRLSLLGEAFLGACRYARKPRRQYCGSQLRPAHSRWREIFKPRRREQGELRSEGEDNTYRHRRGGV